MKRHRFAAKASLIFGLLYLSALVLSSCGKKPPQPKPPGGGADFTADVLPILQARCNTSGCHGGQTAADTAGGLVFSSFDTMRQTVGNRNTWAKPLVIPGNSDSSHLVLTIRRLRQSFMPPASALPQSEIKTISDWIQQGAKGPGGKKFPTYAQGKVYVANSSDGRVDVIDLSVNYKVDSISMVVPGELPGVVQTHHIVASPDKKFIYVTNAWAFGHIIKIDAEADTVIGRVRAGYQPADIVVSPDGQFVYTTDYNLGVPGTSVVRKTNTQTMTVVKTFSVGQAPHGIAISKDGNLVLAASQWSDDCWFIYPNGDSTFRLTLSDGINPNPATTSRFYGPFGIVFSKNDSLAFISCIDSTASHRNHQIRIVEVKSRTVVDSIVLSPIDGLAPYVLALSPTGDTLYAACWGSNTVAVVNLISKSAAYITVGQRPHAPAFDKIGGFLYVTCEGDHVNPYKVYVMNPQTNSVVDSITVGRYPNGISFMEP